MNYALFIEGLQILHKLCNRIFNDFKIAMKFFNIFDETLIIVKVFEIIKQKGRLLNRLLPIKLYKFLQNDGILKREILQNLFYKSSQIIESCHQKQFIIFHKNGFFWKNESFFCFFLHFPKKIAK